MYLRDRVRLLFKAKKPKGSFDEYVGRSIVCMDGKAHTIVTMVGSMVKPTRFEINGEQHVVILDFYKQINNDTSITQEDVDQFDAMEHEVVSNTTKRAPNLKLAPLTGDAQNG